MGISTLYQIFIQTHKLEISTMILLTRSMVYHKNVSIMIRKPLVKINV